MQLSLPNRRSIAQRRLTWATRLLHLLFLLSLTHSMMAGAQVVAHGEGRFHPVAHLSTASVSAAFVAVASSPADSNEDDEVIYLDSAGYIRVWDPQPPTVDSTVEWVSPVGGWRDIAVADVNGDGDSEILAVGGEAHSGRLVIYDPVLVSGTIVPEQVTNTIPWAILYDTPLAGRPITIRTGEFVTAIAGPEIAFVFELNPEDKTDSEDETRMAIWQAIPKTDDSVDGTAWEDTGLFVDVNNTWEHLAVGDLDNAVRDEFALIDDGVGMVRVYRLEEVLDGGATQTELKLLYENKSPERPWLHGVVARFVPGPLQELALARSSPPGNNTFWVLFYDPSQEAIFGDSYAEFLLPPPRTLFAGDVDNNGDDEIFLLRDVPTNVGSRPHLIMRNYNNAVTPLPVFEQILDADNGYRGGTTGDIDGDGRAEVVIMRNNNLRAYSAPESGAATALNFTPPATTNQRVVHTGNLDRNGYMRIPALGVSPPQFNSLTVYSGEMLSTQLRLTTLATGAQGAIPFALTLTDSPTWLSVTPQSGETTADITVQVDATELAAGAYESTIVVSSPDSTVANSPFPVNVVVTVLPGLVVAEKSLLTPLRCDDDGIAKQTLAIDGPEGLIFSASIVSTTAGSSVQSASQQAPATPNVVWPSAVDWVSATSPNILPTTLELTYHGSAVADGVISGNARLELVFFDSFGRQARTVDLAFYCADHQRYLPVIRQ